VRSVIGRFLEHHRVVYFKSTDAVYLASADWMDRNFFRRIEICFPILDPKLKQRVINESLINCLADNSQAWIMDSEGRYQRAQSHGKQAFSSQLALIDMLSARPGATKP